MNGASSRARAKATNQQDIWRLHLLQELNNYYNMLCKRSKRLWYCKAQWK
jgi:hypothetical protein